MTDTLADFITRDRERLTKEREAIFSQQQELEQKLAEIKKEMRAIDAYEAAKKPGRTNGTRRTQSRRGSKRDGVMEIIKAHPAGLTRGELLEMMHMKGDKSAEMSVSNALTALTKGNQIRRNDAKKYVLAASA